LPLNAPNCTPEEKKTDLYSTTKSFKLSKVASIQIIVLPLQFSKETKLRFQTMSTCLGGFFKSFKVPRVASTQIIVFLLQIFKDIKLQFQTMFTCLSNSFQKLEASGSS
jgi:hypothetical protein